MPGRAAPERIRYETVSFRAMNTDVSALLDIRGAALDAEAATELLFETLMDAERRMSRFLPDSELSRWNAGGTDIVLSPALYDCILQAWDIHVRTDGLITPFVLEALEAAGYDRSFERLIPGRVERKKETADVRVRRHARLAFDHVRRVIGRAPGDTRLDLGGFAKGWAVEAAARLLRDGVSVRRGLIDAGGDIAAWGGERKTPWRVEVADPFGDRPIAEITLTNGAVATSGTVGRRWICSDGTVGHHLIDPRTMRPAESDVVQCTAVGGQLVECEAAAKLVCLLGSRRGPVVAGRVFPGVTLLFVTASGKVRVTGSAVQAKRRVNDDDVC